MVNIIPFVSKTYIIIKNNIKLYLTFGTWVAFFYMYLFIIILININSNKRPDPLLDYLKTLSYKTYIFYLLIFSIFLIALIFVFAYYLKVQKANSNDKNHQYLKILYNYYPILPLFMISTGFLLTTFYIFNTLFSTLGLILFFLGFFLYYIMFIVKANWETKVFYTLHKANEILNDMNFDNRKYNNIKEFNKYFKKTLNNIDRNLRKGIKINDITKEDNSSINIPVKSTIIYYLPIYMEFGNKEQICSLKNRISQMLTLVKKNDEFDLIISKVILDIYKDIEDFLHLNKFPVTEQKRGFSLSVLKDRDFLIFVQSIISVIIIILTKK